MDLIPRENLRWIKYHFENYHRIRKAVKLRREELIKTSAQAIRYDGDHLQPTNKINDPVGSLGQELGYIRRVEIGPNETVEHPEKWLKVIESTVNRFNDLRGEVIERCYFKGQPHAKAYSEMSLPKSTFYDWEAEILLFASMVGIKLGLLDLKF